MEDKRAQYSDNLMRSYGYGKKPDHNFSKEQPSHHKISLLHNSLPIELASADGTQAKILLNKNLDIVFELNGQHTYYCDVKNSTLEKFNTNK